MTSLTRWNPFEELNSLHRELDRVFSRRAGDVQAGVHDGAWVPATEVNSAADGWRVRVALPGVDPKDVEIDLHGNTLTVKGDRAAGRGGDGWYESEISYGRFERAFTLPASVDADRVEAHFANGMLELTLPLAESARPRRIEIGSRTAEAA